MLNYLHLHLASQRVSPCVRSEENARCRYGCICTCTTSPLQQALVHLALKRIG